MKCVIASLCTEDEAERAKQFFDQHGIPVKINTPGFPFAYDLRTDPQHHALALLIKENACGLEHMQTGETVRVAQWNQTAEPICH